MLNIPWWETHQWRQFFWAKGVAADLAAARRRLDLPVQPYWDEVRSLLPLIKVEESELHLVPVKIEAYFNGNYSQI